MSVSDPTGQEAKHLLLLWEVRQYFKQLGGAGIAQLVVLGLAVHSVAGSILLWELTWVQTPFPQKLFRMRI